ncbi:hypothetical protein MMC12_004411 [Toensbergia leucococca]|nr:hypothetical protein [Toensbergia leucococca]
MASKPISSRSTVNTGSHVRRNLFHHHLSRRPTSASTSTTSTTLQESPQDNNSDIVIRDHNGNYQVQVPLLPPLDEDQQPEDEGREKEKLEARLLQTYRNRTIQTGEPTELLVAVQSSLRRKVASLEDDNWIFEAEQETPS